MTSPAPTRRIVMGITGASGAAYAVRLLDCLVLAEVEVHLVVSPFGRRLLAEEVGVKEPTVHALLGRDSDRVIVRPYNDVGTGICSGSFPTSGMVICPCSSNTLAAIAAGISDNALNRAAAVTLKEMRRLVLVTREMPMSRIDLKNGLRLSRSGAVICPAAPGLYLKPRTIDDLVDFVAGKVLDLMDVPHSLNTRWHDRRVSRDDHPRATSP